MSDNIYSIEEIKALVKPLAQKYQAEQVYLFGSYARGEAGIDSDLDFIVYGGKNFILTDIFALAEELREVASKKVDMFEIHEVNKDSDFYRTILKERVRIV